MIQTIPEVGSEVIVVTKFSESYLFSKEKFRYDTFHGVVVRSESWLQPHEFNVKTGNPKYPTSTISLKNVDKITYVSGSGRKIHTQSDIREFKVLSKSTGKMYFVKVTGTKVTCDCPGYTFRRACKHIDAVAKKIGLKKA